MRSVLTDIDKATGPLDLKIAEKIMGAVHKHGRWEIDGNEITIAPFCTDEITAQSIIRQLAKAGWSFTWLNPQPNSGFAWVAHFERCGVMCEATGPIQSWHSKAWAICEAALKCVGEQI